MIDLLNDPLGSVISGEVLAVRDVVLKTARNGSQFIVGKIGNKLGYVDFILWDSALAPFETNVVECCGTLSEYNGSRQVQLDVVNTIQEVENFKTQLLPSISDADMKQLKNEMKQSFEAFRDPIQPLLEAFFSETFLDDFATSVAAKSNHHAYIGGLIEHTMTICNLADDACMLYDYLDRDIVIAGVMLHDAGKVLEIDPSFGFNYTKMGSMVGHMALANDRLMHVARELHLEDHNDTIDLSHIIMSHHGCPEWGSPVRPQTREALVVHFLENLDAKLNSATSAIKEALSRDEDKTGYVFSCQSYFFTR